MIFTCNSDVECLTFNGQIDVFYRKNTRTNEDDLDCMAGISLSNNSTNHGKYILEWITQTFFIVILKGD